MCAAWPRRPAGLYNNITILPINAVPERLSCSQLWCFCCNQLTCAAKLRTNIAKEHPEGLESQLAILHSNSCQFCKDVQNNSTGALVCMMLDVQCRQLHGKSWRWVLKSDIKIFHLFSLSNKNCENIEICQIWPFLITSEKWNWDIIIFKCGSFEKIILD